MANDDVYGYSTKSVGELNAIIADLVRNNLDLKEAKDDYVSSTNEVIKENNNKIQAALVARKVASQTDGHEERVADFLGAASK